MSLPRAPGAYSKDDQDRFRKTLDQRDTENRKKQQDVEVAGTERLILSSPNGSRFNIVVSNAGALSAVAL
jgi:hypothetical protein